MKRRLSEAVNLPVPGDIEASSDTIFDEVNPFDALTPPQRLGKRVCDADAIIIGKIGNKTAYLNAEETLVYSEYEITIQDVIKNKGELPIQVNASIQVIRPGGTIRLNGRLVRFTVRKYTPLLRGNFYLLFLKYIPETNSYMPPDDSLDYLLTGDKAIPAKLKDISGAQLEVIPEDATSLISFVRHSSNLECK